ncbi:MAG: lytic transglycosylase domain-containing protein [Alphaproteobacteria bacterium]|nr:transglycosylase SLT domain-containing protein [Candidatus Jidaibacter sp.]
MKKARLVTKALSVIICLGVGSYTVALYAKDSVKTGDRREVHRKAKGYSNIKSKKSESKKVVTINSLTKSNPVNKPYNLHPNDDVHLYKAFKYAIQKDWYKALHEASHSKDKQFAKDSVTAIKLYLEPSSMQLSSSSEFINSTDWLPKETYEKKIDRLINPSYTASDIIAFYKHREPHTNNAKIMLIDAKIKSKILSINSVEVQNYIREIWRSSEFDIATEEYTISAYKDILSIQDCLDKIDKLSWNKSFALASKLIELLPNNIKDTPKSRLYLLKNISDGKYIESPRDLHLSDIHAYYKVSQLIKVGDYSAATKILLRAAKLKSSSERWWKLTNIVVREALEHKEYQAAYDLIQSHNLSVGSDYAEAEFLAGWISLRLLNEPADSLKHFHNLYDNAKLGNTRSKAAYWLGRGYEALGDKKNALDWYTVGSYYTSAFYGQLCLAFVKKSAKINYFTYMNQTSKVKTAQRKTKSSIQKSISFAYYLFKNDQKLLSYSILNSIPAVDANAIDAGNSISFFNQRALYPLSVELGRAYSNKAFLTLKESYPSNVKIVGNKLDKAIYYSIIRQESNFDQSAISKAGATGLMQLMPATAERLASILKLPKNSYATDSNSNVLKGVTYIDQLYTQFDSYILTIASYNAGPGNVRKWLSKFGDVREYKDIHDKLDWIEMIPFLETRNYVKKVIENMVIYDYTLSPSHNCSSIHKFVQ